MREGNEAWVMLPLSESDKQSRQTTWVKSKASLVDVKEEVSRMVRHRGKEEIAVEENDNTSTTKNLFKKMKIRIDRSRSRSGSRSGSRCGGLCRSCSPGRKTKKNSSRERPFSSSASASASLQASVTTDAMQSQLSHKSISEPKKKNVLKSLKAYLEKKSDSNRTDDLQTIGHSSGGNSRPSRGGLSSSSLCSQANGVNSSSRSLGSGVSWSREEVMSIRRKRSESKRSLDGSTKSERRRTLSNSRTRFDRSASEIDRSRRERRKATRKSSDREMLREDAETKRPTVRDRGRVGTPAPLHSIQQTRNKSKNSKGTVTIAADKRKGSHLKGTVTTVIDNEKKRRGRKEESENDKPIQFDISLYSTTDIVENYYPEPKCVENTYSRRSVSLDPSSLTRKSVTNRIKKVSSGDKTTVVDKGREPRMGVLYRDVSRRKSKEKTIEYTQMLNSSDDEDWTEKYDSTDLSTSKRSEDTLDPNLLARPSIHARVKSITDLFDEYRMEKILARAELLSKRSEDSLDPSLLTSSTHTKVKSIRDLFDDFKKEKKAATDTSCSLTTNTQSTYQKSMGSHNSNNRKTASSSGSSRVSNKIRKQTKPRSTMPNANERRSRPETPKNATNQVVLKSAKLDRKENQNGSLAKHKSRTHRRKSGKVHETSDVEFHKDIIKKGATGEISIDNLETTHSDETHFVSNKTPMVDITQSSGHRNGRQRSSKTSTRRLYDGKDVSRRRSLHRQQSRGNSQRISSNSIKNGNDKRHVKNSSPN